MSTVVVVGNPFRKLRMILDQVFQGLNNLFFDKDVEEIQTEIIKNKTTTTEPKKYIQKGGEKQMCDAEPYHTEHAYGLVYDYEEEKVAPSFNGPQFQVYLERATELCDEDPECKYFNLWTDGGITKFREGQCENLKDTINSTLTYEKIPNPPSLGTECEDKGYKPYNWYDFNKSLVPLSVGAGEANAVWDENGTCVRTSCKDGETKELNILKKCVPSTIEEFSKEQEQQRVYEDKVEQDVVDKALRVFEKKKQYNEECRHEGFNFYYDNKDATTYEWIKDNKSFPLSRDSWTRYNQCSAAVDELVTSADIGFDGLNQDWETGGEMADWW